MRSTSVGSGVWRVEQSDTPTETPAALELEPELLFYRATSSQTTLCGEGGFCTSQQGIMLIQRAYNLVYFAVLCLMAVYVGRAQCLCSDALGSALHQLLAMHNCGTDLA